MTDPSTELLLRVNGIQAAFGIELGFASPRVAGLGTVGVAIARRRLPWFARRPLSSA